MIAYAITSPSTLNFDTLQDDLIYFSKKASMIVYRDKTTTHYEKNAKQFLNFARGFTKSFDKVLLHSDYRLAAKLNAEGVHLTSTQFTDIVPAGKLGLFVIVSTHSVAEALEAESLGANMVTMSPVFDTPNKGDAIGLAMLGKVTSSLSIPVIALGGILTQDQIQSCANVGARGFASIRYFI